jgi:hypothetical protein
MSATTMPLPLYGTCSISVPVIILNISIVRCGPPPVPVEA